MSVAEPDVVDIVGVDRESGAVVLTISDHLDWIDEGQHCLTLQEKVNGYLRFIESGELELKYPNAKGRPVRIEVQFQYMLPATAVAFLVKAQQVVEGAGFELTYRVHGDSAAK